MKHFFRIYLNVLYSFIQLSFMFNKTDLKQINRGINTKGK